MIAQRIGGRSINESLSGSPISTSTSIRNAYQGEGLAKRHKVETIAADEIGTGVAA